MPWVGPRTMTKTRPDAPDRRASSEASPKTRDVEAALRRHYPQVQYAFVEFISGHLADVSRVFKGDLQFPVLLAVIGQTTIKGHAAATRAGVRLQDIDPRSLGLTSFRLADATGIPRETVRRKLLEMQRRGWLERKGNYWTLVFEGDRAKLLDDLGDLDARGLERLARLFVGIAPWVGSA